MTLASGQVNELGETHGLRGLYRRNGPEFQVLYVTRSGQHACYQINDHTFWLIGSREILSPRAPIERSSRLELRRWIKSERTPFYGS
jgi:hypothetical protein